MFYVIRKYIDESNIDDILVIQQFKKKKPNNKPC